VLGIGNRPRLGRVFFNGGQARMTFQNAEDWRRSPSGVSVALTVGFLSSRGDFFSSSSLVLVVVLRRGFENEDEGEDEDEQVWLRPKAALCSQTSQGAEPVRRFGAARDVASCCETRVVCRRTRTACGQ